MDTVMESINGQMAQLRRSLNDVPGLQKLEDQYGVPKEYLSVAAASLLLLFIVFGLSAGTMSSIVGFVYPAYMSFQALEHRASGEVTQWLVYWVVYSFFSIVEVFSDALLYWIPFYYAFKVAFLLWAMLPQTRGAKFLYDGFLKDFLKSNEVLIDAAMGKAKEKKESLSEEAKRAAMEAATKAAKDKLAEKMNGARGSDAVKSPEEEDGEKKAVGEGEPSYGGGGHRM